MEISNLYFDGCKVCCTSILLDSKNRWVNVVGCDLTGIIDFLIGNIKNESVFSVGIDTNNGYYDSLCFVGMVSEEEESFTLCLSGKINKGYK